MGGSARLPLGPLPVLKKATRPFSPQRCHRRLPLVRSGDVLCQPLTGSMGWMFSTAPFHLFDQVLASRNLIGLGEQGSRNSQQRAEILHSSPCYYEELARYGCGSIWL